MPPKRTIPRTCLDCPTDISNRGNAAKRCVPCAKARKRKMEREYWQKPKNRERHRKRVLKYWNESDAKVRQRERNAKPENRKRKRERERVRASKPEAKERRRKYRALPENQKRRREYLKEYYTNPENKERKRASDHRRRALKNGAKLGVKTPGIHLIRAQEQKQWCYWRKVRPECPGKFTKANPATEDHHIPIALGGADEDTNIVAAHQTCNSSKGAKHPIQFAQDNGRLL